MSSNKIVIERTRDLIYLKFVATDFSPEITSPSTGGNSGDSAYPLLFYSFCLVDEPFTRSFKLFATLPHPLPHSVLVSSGQTLYQATSWRLILQSSLLQRFTAESSLELSALRKLNNKQRQVSMFLLKFLIRFSFVSFLSISILSLLPFSILSLLPLAHPFFIF